MLDLGKILLELFAHAAGVLLIPFLVDLLILDWLMFCTITPKFVVIPGDGGVCGLYA